MNAKQERQVVISSRQQPLDLAQPFYNFISDVNIDAQSAKYLELRAATLSLQLPTINANNRVFTWTRDNPAVATFTVNLTLRRQSPIEIMTDLAALMSAADPLRNYFFANPNIGEYEIRVNVGNITNVAVTSFTQSLLFDMPLDATRVGNAEIYFYNFQNVVIPSLYLVIRELTEEADHKGSVANNLLDQITTLDLSGGHQLIHYCFENPIRLGFWNRRRMPDRVKVQLETYPGTPRLQSYYINQAVPTHAYLELHFVAVKET